MFNEQGAKVRFCSSLLSISSSSFFFASILKVFVDGQLSWMIVSSIYDVDFDSS